MRIDEHWRVDGDPGASWTLVLAHGAGAGMDTPWMHDFSGRLVDRGLRVVRFEFPYMRRRRETGGRRPPDRMPVLQDAYREVLQALAPGCRRLAIGGKSMGGRVASHVADAEGVNALVCLGYPFHPPGKPQTLRTAHLGEIARPTLIVQGERDPFGTPEEVAGYALDPGIRMHWLGDGDHGFKPRKRSGFTLEGHLDEAASVVSEFLEGQVDARNE